jgi:hypothetical protein
VYQADVVEGRVRFHLASAYPGPHIHLSRNGSMQSSKSIFELYRIVLNLKFLLNIIVLILRINNNTILNEIRNIYLLKIYILVSSTRVVCPRRLYIAARHGFINHDFTMMPFEKVKMSFVKMTKVLKRRMDLIFWLTLLIVLTGVYVWVEIDDPAKIWENKAVKMKCNDPGISYPMTSDELQIFLKVILIGLGLIFSCILEYAFGLLLFYTVQLNTGIHLPQNAANVLIKKGIFMNRLLLRIAGFLIGLLAALILTKPVNPGIVEILFSKRNYLSRNFLAICKPQGLDLLCGIDSHDWVGVVCTTPVDMWMPAVKSLIPTMVIVYYYLMFTSFFRLTFKWDWMRSKNGFCLGLFLQAISIALIVSVGAVTVFYCNEAASDGLFDGCILTSLTAVIMTFIDHNLAIKNENNFPEEEELPRYWNDVPKKKMIPQVSQLPTILLPPCGYRNPSAMMLGTELKPKKDHFKNTPPTKSIYPKLPALEDFK